MTKDMLEYLATIEVADTSATLERLKAIREQARREVEEENNKALLMPKQVSTIQENEAKRGN